MTGYLQVQTTFDRREDAESTARSLVSGRLAACVQIVGPVRSIYWWEGAVEEADEWLLLAKTTAAAFPRLREAITGLHPYEVPEIIALPVAEASGEYLSWIDREVSG